MTDKPRPPLPKPVVFDPGRFGIAFSAEQMYEFYDMGINLGAHSAVAQLEALQSKQAAPAAQEPVAWRWRENAAVAAQALPAEYHKRLFEATIRDLAAISENLGLDPDEGGAAPIIEAINELRRERDDWVDAQYAAQAQPTSTTSPREEFPLLYDSLDELTSRLDSHQSRDYVFSLRDSIQAVVQKLSLARARVADLEAAAKAQPNGAEIEQLRSENMEMRSTLNVLAPGDKPTHSVNEVLHDLSEAVARLLGWNYWDMPGQPSKDAEFARAALRKARGDE